MSGGYTSVSLLDLLKASVRPEIGHMKKRKSLSVSPVDVSKSIMKRQIKRHPHGSARLTITIIGCTHLVVVHSDLKTQPPEKSLKA